MVKKLTRHGNSLALVIERPILDLLRIDGETPLDITTDGQRLIIARAEPSERRRKFEAAQRTAHRRYGKAFQKLGDAAAKTRPNATTVKAMRAADRGKGKRVKSAGVLVKDLGI